MAARDAYNQFLRCWADGSQEKMDEEFLIKLAKMDYLLRKYGIQSTIHTGGPSIPGSGLIDKDVVLEAEA